MSPDINMTLSHTDKIPIDTNITWAHCDKTTLDTNMTLSNKNKILLDSDNTLSHTDKILSDSNMPLAHINEMPPDTNTTLAGTDGIPLVNSNMPLAHINEMPPNTNTTLAGTDGNMVARPLASNMVLACLNNRETPSPFVLTLFSNSTFTNANDHKTVQFLMDIAKLYFAGDTAKVNNKINHLHFNIYLNIFEQICTDDIFKTELVSVKKEILMVKSIQNILRQYKKYLCETKDWTYIFFNLILYLQVNVKHVVEVVKRIIFMNSDSEALKSSNSSNIIQFMEENDYIQLSCPYEDLKTISYESYNDTVILNNQRAHKTNLMETNTILNILHWPNIKITIQFPKFEGIHYTVSHSKFKLVKQGTDFKQNFETFDTSLRCKKPYFKTYFYRSQILIEYLAHVIKSIENYSCLPNWKLVILDVLRQFMNDLRRCTDNISILTEYYAPLTSHSYIRYLPHKLTHSLDKNKSQRLDLCLQEQLTPVLMFQVKNFFVKFKTRGINDYEFEPFRINTSSMKSDFLKFECTTCDLKFSGYFACFELINHLANDHGSETDWTCVLCNKEFSMKNLSDNIWQHQCLKHK